ncbi:hypothetical protein CFI00_09775 [Nocardioides sp. S5]|uniref:hypothetical protein n=1 Tax=Nocardioides sp. S5 TaxID=2017486 RepID=UPI001A8EBDE1|nr:hypothetical protein [Nocardioides sp. S5]QSR30775.1 hypothetical protein CFI00_09775 [Nocardioides sp. S5]
MTPQQASFADYFDKWGLTLPDEAVARRSNGHVNGAGWSVRFVWQDDGTLLFRANHRMTNERVHAIALDGELTWAEPAAPAEFVVIPEGATPEDNARIQSEYQHAWTAYSEAIALVGLDFDPNSPPVGLHDAPSQTWRLDDGDWQSGPLHPAGRASSTHGDGSARSRQKEIARGGSLTGTLNRPPAAEQVRTESQPRNKEPACPASGPDDVEGGCNPPTAYFASLVEPFAAGLLHKCHALLDLDLNSHQRSRLREAISIDLRKMCDILVPAARPPRISEAANAIAATMGVDLRTATWHSQKKIDGYKTFTYEHMTPVNWFVSKIGEATSPEEVLGIIDQHMWITWVTKEEDAELRRLGYSSTRPNPASAYEDAGVALLPVEPDPDLPSAKSDTPAGGGMSTPVRLVDARPPLYAGDRWLPQAWAMGAKGIPPAPTEEDVSGSRQREHAAEEMLAFWAPLLHLLTWGLGWIRPDIGLVEWRRCGSASDPVLDLVARWWTPAQLEDFLAWAETSGALSDFAQDFLNACPDLRITERDVQQDLDLDPKVLGRQKFDDWTSRWDAYDPYRIVEHLTQGWRGSSDSAPLNPVPVQLTNGTLLVAAHKYARWASLPRHYQYGGDALIDVYVANVGALGTFTQSQTTGLWHRTLEEIHLLGYPLL